jgi:uncharacterized protein YcbX
MPSIGSVAELWRYPAKSMMGDRHAALPVGEMGIAGDRGWAVRDEVRGGIRGAKKIGGLMGLHARYVTEPALGLAPPPITIELPDGATVSSEDADVDQQLTAALDHGVSLWRLQPPEDLDHYRRGAPDSEDFEVEMRSIFGRTSDEPLPTFEGLPLDVLMEYESPPGTYFDAFPMLVMTDRSLATLSSLAPDSKIDVRRFRPNVVVALGDDVDGTFPEQDWIGRRLQIGDVELAVGAPCPRCVMVTRGFDDVPEDRAVLRTVVRQAQQNLGVYASVVRGGDLHTGAPVSLL